MFTQLDLDDFPNSARGRGNEIKQSLPIFQLVQVRRVVFGIDDDDDMDR